MTLYQLDGEGGTSSVSPSSRFHQTRGTQQPARNDGRFTVVRTGPRLDLGYTLFDSTIMLAIECITALLGEVLVDRHTLDYLP